MSKYFYIFLILNSSCNNNIKQNKSTSKLPSLPLLFGSVLNCTPINSDAVKWVQNSYKFSFCGVSKQNDSIYKYASNGFGLNHIYFVNMNNSKTDLIIKFRSQDTLINGLFYLDSNNKPIRSIIINYEEKKIAFANIKYGKQKLYYCTQNLDSLKFFEVVEKINLCKNFIDVSNMIVFPGCNSYSDDNDPYSDLFSGSIWKEW